MAQRFRIHLPGTFILSCVKTWLFVTSPRSTPGTRRTATDWIWIPAAARLFTIAGLMLVTTQSVSNRAGMNMVVNEDDLVKRLLSPIALFITVTEDSPSEAKCLV